MKAAYLVPCRNKAKWVRRCVQSVLAQTFPCEIVLSDQGSTDGTREILAEIAAAYRGHHTVRLLDCPWQNYQGMAGMNIHLNWLMDQTDADVILITSADDFTHPDRALKTVECFATLKPSMVLTGMYFTDPDLKPEGVNAYPSKDCWVDFDSCLKQGVGGSTSIAWTREFWDKVKPMPAVPGNDVFLPFLALLDRGAYYLDEKLHYYIRYADLENTGLEGVWRAAGETEKIQLEELMHFQVMTAYYSALACMGRNGWMSEAASAALYEQILDRGASWCNVRQRMSLERITPIPLKV